MNCVNLTKDRFAKTSSRDLFRANQIVLGMQTMFGASIGPWSSGIDTYGENHLLFAFPKSGLNFPESDVFLKALKNNWEISGFNVIDEREAIGYRSGPSYDYSYIISLEIAS